MTIRTAEPGWVALIPNSTIPRSWKYAAVEMWDGVEPIIAESSIAGNPVFFRRANYEELRRLHLSDWEKCRVPLVPELPEDFK